MFEIRFANGAIEDLKSFKRSDRRRIVDGVETQLAEEPNLATRNRKRLRPNRLAEWELRLGRFRIFYDVSNPKRLVKVVAVGRKERDRLTIGGEEYKL